VEQFCGCSIKHRAASGSDTLRMDSEPENFCPFAAGGWLENWRVFGEVEKFSPFEFP